MVTTRRRSLVVQVSPKSTGKGTGPKERSANEDTNMSPEASPSSTAVVGTDQKEVRRKRGPPIRDKVGETAEKKVSGRRSLPAMKAPAKEKKLRLEEQATVIRRKRVKNVDTEGPIDAAKRTSESVQSDEKDVEQNLPNKESEPQCENETDGSSVPLKKKKRAKSEKALSGSNDKGTINAYTVHL
ncbi:hypothetical protein COOONC_10460 [Cooperia oncophora]